jgi:hypothetical protein
MNCHLIWIKLKLLFYVKNIKKNVTSLSYKKKKDESCSIISILLNQMNCHLIWIFHTLNISTYITSTSKHFAFWSKILALINDNN